MTLKQRHQQTKHALGSTAYMTIVIEGNPEPIFTALWDETNAFEQRFSRFLQDSELTNFNKYAGAKQSLSPEFIMLLQATRDMAQKTGGLYNPFVLPALQRAGYKGSWPDPQAAHPGLNYENRESASWKDIVITDNRACIPANTALDFGGIGKGYLLDKLASVLQEEGVHDYWLSLGGDILCAGQDVTGEPWQIAIQDAISDDKIVASVTNNNQKTAIATSGITKRKGQTSSGAWHHIIDPRSGLPADTNVLTATVCAATATEADVYAKCLVIVGSNGAKTFIKSVDQQNALLQLADRTMQKFGAVWSA